MLIIECPFCGEKEEREFRDGRSVHHSIVCDECKIIERGRMTLSDMSTAISVIMGSFRPRLGKDYHQKHRLHDLHNLLKQSIEQIDLYIDEVPF